MLIGSQLQHHANGVNPEHSLHFTYVGPSYEGVALDAVDVGDYMDARHHLLLTLWAREDIHTACGKKASERRRGEALPLAYTSSKRYAVPVLPRKSCPHH